MLSSSILLKNKEVLVEKWPGKIWESEHKFLQWQVTLEHDTSLHHCDCLGWVIFLMVHSYIWFIMPSLRFWVNVANSSQYLQYIQEKSSSKSSFFCNTHKPSFSWQSSLNITISNHIFHVFLIFCVAESIKSMQYGYSLDGKLNFASNGYSCSKFE